MFNKLLRENVPEDTLWNQCRKALLNINRPVSVFISEIDRLVALVSHQAMGDFSLEIQDVVSDTVNGFMDDLPF